MFNSYNIIKRYEILKSASYSLIFDYINFEKKCKISMQGHTLYSEGDAVDFQSYTGMKCRIERVIVVENMDVKYMGCEGRVVHTSDTHTSLHHRTHLYL